MKTQILSLALCCVAGFAAKGQLAQSGVLQPAQTVAAWSVTEVGGNSRTWTRGFERIVELQTGMSFWNGSQLVPSNPSFQISPDGATFVASQVQHKVNLGANLNTVGAVALTTPDGIVLQSTPVGIGLYDAASGQSLVIGAITNCIGVLVNSNQVVYKNAFCGISADVVITLNRGSFEQDVVLTENINPADWTFSPNTARIQIWSELYGTVPQPDEIVRPIYVEKSQAIRNRMVSPDLVDETLGFGEFVLAAGKAYSVGTTVTNARAPVAKEFKTINGRTFLIESVEYRSIQRGLNALPQQSRQIAKSKAAKSRIGYALIPKPGTPSKVAAVRTPAQMAMATAKRAGIVIDYVGTIGGPLSETTIFKGDTTYFVSGPVYCTGDVTIEGGAVFKYRNDTDTSVEIESSLTCKTAPYRPAIFTAADDNSVGDTLSTNLWSGYTGTIQSGGYANPALQLDNGGAVLSDLRFNYAQQAIYDADAFGGSITVAHSQLLNCLAGVNIFNGSGGSPIAFNNCLIANVGSIMAFDIGYSDFTFNHCTIDNSTLGGGDANLGGAGIHFNNCVLANLNWSDVTPAGYINGFYNDNINGYDTFGDYPYTAGNSPFQTVGAGNYYLTGDSGFRGSGVAYYIDPILLAAIRQRTTYPPIIISGPLITTNLTLSPQVQRDTYGNPDLGYHYDPIDYAVSGVSVSEAIMAVYPDTVIAAFGAGSNYFGLDLGQDVEFICKGLATNWNRIVAYNTVQEQAGTNWQRPTNGLITVAAGSFTPPTVDCRFTDWSVLAQDAPHLAFSNNAPVALRDCQFHGGALIFDYPAPSDPTLNFDNCLLERVNSIFDVADSTVPSILNNLFYGGVLNFAPTVHNAVVQNNLFDRTSISDNSAVYGTYIGGYNAYFTNCDRLQPTFTNDLILSSNSLAYQAGPLGDYYQPAGSPLTNLGSTNANQLGLYDYTILTNLVAGREIKETNSIVDIGYHYVAVDTNGAPLDTYTNDTPDYLITSSINPIPDSWEWIYFGNLDQATNADYDLDGTNNLAEYQNSNDPNKISFSFSLPNQYVSTNIVSGVITILGGVPSSIAVLVDTTNTAAATWTTYSSSTVTVNLGTNQGPHDVWIGLRGRLTISYQTWDETTIILDSVPPTISITNPTNNASLNSTRVNVHGNFTSAALNQITINGVLAFASGTNFDALNVPLNAGSNTITAIVGDLTGYTNIASINVIGTTNTDGSMNNPVQLQATPVAGFAPQQVTFTVQTNLPGTILQVLYDFNGDDVVDLTTNNLLSLTFTYPTNGEYFPVVTIQTTAGWFSSIGGWNSFALDPSNQPVRINVQAPVTIISTISVTNPVDIQWVAPSNLYVLSGSTATLTEFDTNGTTLRSLSGIGYNPSGIGVDTAGNVYVAATSSNQVWKFNPTTNSLIADTNFGVGGCIGLPNSLSGTNNGEFNAPFDVAVSPDGSQISVSDSGNNRIQQFDTNGVFITSFGSQGTNVGQFNTPKGLSYDSVGYLYVVDSGNNRIALAPSSAVAGVSGTNGTALGQFSAPVSISVGERGMYVADTGNNRIQVFDLLANGVYSFEPSDIRFAVSTNLNQPAAIAAVDNLTNEMFYVADTGNDRVILYKLPSDDPTPAWTNMTTHITTGDISGAISSFSSVSAEGYRQAFLCIGTADLISDINEIGTLTLVFIKNDTAEYYFEQTIDGQLLLFPVEFVKENGVWKILEF